MSTEDDTNGESEPERTFSALATLATGRGDLKDRLVAAWNEDLVHLVGTDIPNEYADRFKALQEKLSGAAGAERFIRDLDSDGTDALADEIFTLCLDAEIFGCPV